MKGVGFMPKEKENRKELIEPQTLASCLDELSPEDIPENSVPKVRTDPLNVVRKAMLFVCLAVFVYCGGMMVDQLMSKVRANSAYEDLRELFYDDSGLAPDGALLRSPSAAPAKPITGNVYYDEDTQDVDEQFLIRNQLTTLKSINPDIYGWIKIDGTRVDYPVVQGKDNDYYLHYTFKKEYLYSGTLFVDYRNSKSLLRNYNTVIYGHNMTDGSMFNTLYNFKDRKFFENGLIEVTTDEGLFIYEVFSAHVVNEKDPYFVTLFEDEEEFISFAEIMQMQSIYSKNINFAANDRVLTLSTCTNVRNYERFAVHARLISPVIELEE